jgi:hypothetical protein
LELPSIITFLNKILPYDLLKDKYPKVWLLSFGDWKLSGVWSLAIGVCCLLQTVAL